MGISAPDNLWNALLKLSQLGAPHSVRPHSGFYSMTSINLLPPYSLLSWKWKQYNLRQRLCTPTRLHRSHNESSGR